MQPGSSHAIAAIMIRRHATHSSPAFFPLPTHLARRYHGGADADDLQQVASLGLLKAIDRFDPERGHRVHELCRPHHPRRAQALLPRPRLDRPGAARPARAQAARRRHQPNADRRTRTLTHPGRTRRARPRDDRTDPRGPRRRHRPPPRLARPAAQPTKATTRSTSSPPQSPASSASMTPRSSTGCSTRSPTASASSSDCASRRISRRPRSELASGSPRCTSPASSGKRSRHSKPPLRQTSGDPSASTRRAILGQGRCSQPDRRLRVNRVLQERAREAAWGTARTSAPSTALARRGRSSPIAGRSPTTPSPWTSSN